jgi:hypothetical protein
VNAGDTWSIRVIDNLGATTTYSYVAKDEDSDSDVDRSDVAIGLVNAIGSAAAVDPTDSESIIITSASGIKVDFPSVNAASAQGSMTTSGSSVHSVISKSIDFSGLTVTDGETWTLTLSGTSKSAVIGTDTLNDSTVITTLTDIAQSFAEQFAGSGFTVTFPFSILTASNSSLADFTVSLDPGSNSSPTVNTTRSSTVGRLW